MTLTLEAIVGSEKRLTLIATDIVDHFEKRLEAMDGKAMIVCMSRRICVELYREITKLPSVVLSLRIISRGGFARRPLQIVESDKSNALSQKPESAY